jgi:hypothetical protein
MIAYSEGSVGWHGDMRRRGGGGLVVIERMDERRNKVSK